MWTPFLPPPTPQPTHTTIPTSMTRSLTPQYDYLSASAEWRAQENQIHIFHHLNGNKTILQNVNILKSKVNVWHCNRRTSVITSLTNPTAMGERVRPRLWTLARAKCAGPIFVWPSSGAVGHVTKHIWFTIAPLIIRNWRLVWKPFTGMRAILRKWVDIPSVGRR